MASKFVKPQMVVSPVKRWSLIKVLFDPDKEIDCPLALGLWDNRPVLAIRWNGTADNPVGNPQSRGLATWFILPERYYAGMIETLAPEMKALALSLFPKLK